jgi:type IV secretory pathway VirB10-like protein
MTAEATPLNAKLTPEAASAFDLRQKGEGGKKAQGAAIKILFALTTLILVGAFVFAFILKPRLDEAEREARRAQAQAQQTSAADARPSEVIRSAPASYDRLPAESAIAEALGAETTATAADPRPGPARPAPRQPSITETEAAEAARSPLLFARDARAAEAPPITAPRAPPVTRRLDYADVTLDRAPLPELSANRLAAGTIIPAALETAIDTDLAGTIAARVTANVYDTTTGDILLIPQGARLLGRYDRDVAYGQRRAFLVWERILFPNGSSLSLGTMPGVDAIGAAGVRDQVDYHGDRLLGAIGLGALISTIGEIARDGDDDERSFSQNVGDAAAAEAARVSGRLVERELQVRPTIRIRAGMPVRVILTRDVIFDPAEAAP